MSLLDLLFASEDEQIAAHRFASHAIKEHGSGAVAALEAKLANPRRKASKRSIKLAIKEAKRRLRS